MSQRQGSNQSRTRNADRYPLPFVNDSDETIPPHAVMQLESTDGVPIGDATLAHVVKPNSDGECYVVNGAFSVPAGKRGRCRVLPTLIIKYDGTAPDVGDEWGPVDGEWHLTSAGSGYICLGGAEDDVALWTTVGGGGGGLRYFVADGDGVEAATVDGAEIVPGEGTVQYYTTNGDGNKEEDGDPVTVKNFYFSAVDANCPGWARNHEVVAAGCDPMPGV